jgi:hypothetical protein
MKKTLLAFGVFVLVIGLVALLAWLTMYEEDPCANAQGDVGAAVLADEGGDQGALVNRAIIVGANCDRKKADQAPEESP